MVAGHLPCTPTVLADEKYKSTIKKTLSSLWNSNGAPTSVGVSGFYCAFPGWW